MPLKERPCFVSPISLPVIGSNRSNVSTRPGNWRLYKRTSKCSVRACGCRPCTEAPSSTASSSTEANTRARTAAQTSATSNAGARRQRQSDETRYKISAAMKGRTISASHRSKISASLSGENNPRYGRRLTEETRARISAGVAAAAAAKRASMLGTDQSIPKMSEESTSNISERALRTKALSSPLLTNGRSRRLYDADDEAVDALMQRVRAGGVPPDAVLRKYVQLKKKEKLAKPIIRQNISCTHCSGTGTNACVDCVGAFGTVSERCGTCFGSGVVYCEQCGGTGVGQ